LFGLVEAGKGAASVGWFELSYGVFAFGSLAEIEAAQLVIHLAFKDDVQLCRTGRDGARSNDAGLLAIGIQRDFRLLFCPPGLDRRRFEIDLGRIEDNRRARLQNAQIDSFISIEGVIAEVGGECKLIVLRHSARRQALRLCSQRKHQRESENKKLLHKCSYFFIRIPFNTPAEQEL